MRRSLAALAAGVYQLSHLDSSTHALVALVRTCGMDVVNVKVSSGFFRYLLSKTKKPTAGTAPTATLLPAPAHYGHRAGTTLVESRLE
jgi:hypothetical protein